MNKQFERYLQKTLIILDLVILSFVYFLCQIIIVKTIAPEYADSYVLYWGISIGLWLVLSFFLRTYNTSVILNFEYFFKRTVQVYVVWLILLLFYLFFSREFDLSRLFIMSSIGSFGLGLLMNRFLYLGIKNYFKHSHHLTKKVIIVGYNDTAKKLANYFEEDGINTQLMGFIEDNKNINELSHYPVLADLSDTLQVAKEMDVQEIFSTITPEQNNEIYNLMYQAEKECIRFKIVPNLAVFITREVHIEYFGDLPILSLRSEPLDDVGNRFKKRILDIVISLFVIVFFLSWMVPLFAFIIYLETGQSVFFRQLRTGKNKKSFYCLKFRSMRSNTDADLKQATSNDSRVTGFGRFIRKTSLDEFPQFLNVFKGEMSLVGPRPHMLKHTNDYSKIVDEYMIRQFLKPGITGWAQINGYRGEITNPDQIKMRVDKDVWYLENWNLWLDIQILFLTVYYVLKGDKNAF
ncbi:MAG: exopolysaccharide biosynthesis polyprenyl glycosylphosphotransferase [Ferruginibacter sp.]